MHRQQSDAEQGDDSTDGLERLHSVYADTHEENDQPDRDTTNRNERRERLGSHTVCYVIPPLYTYFRVENNCPTIDKSRPLPLDSRSQYPITEIFTRIP